MFFPPAVMMMAFLRSTMRRWPSGSSSATSPVCSQPSRIGRGGGLRVAVVAHEDGLAPLQELAVRRRCLNSMPGMALPTVPRRTSPRWTKEKPVHSVMP